MRELTLATAAIFAASSILLPARSFAQTAPQFTTLYDFPGGASSACAQGCGTVFSLTSPVSPGTPWTETALYSFANQSDGWGVAGGTLYGLTTWGGIYGNGTVFSLTPPASPGRRLDVGAAGQFREYSGLD